MSNEDEQAMGHMKELLDIKVKLSQLMATGTVSKGTQQHVIQCLATDARTILELVAARVDTREQRDWFIEMGQTLIRTVTEKVPVKGGN